MMAVQSGGGIEHIADHDARMKEIRLLPDGRCEIFFSHLEVSRPTELQGDETEAYEVRVHPGVMLLTGVDSFTCSGQWTAESMLMDGDALDAAGARIQWERLLREHPIRRLELTFFLGTRIEIGAQTAVLGLEGEGTFFERWSDPL